VAGHKSPTITPTQVTNGNGSTDNSKFLLDKAFKQSNPLTSTLGKKLLMKLSSLMWTDILPQRLKLSSFISLSTYPEPGLKSAIAG